MLREGDIRHDFVSRRLQCVSEFGTCLSQQRGRVMHTVCLYARLYNCSVRETLRMRVCAYSSGRLYEPRARRIGVNVSDFVPVWA
eukprot:1118586-Pleurochrysis_carterae.AAC.1